MAEQSLAQIIMQLKSHPSPDYQTSSSLLSRAKLHLLKLSALTPSSAMPTHLLPLARSVYEQGALASIRARDAPAFARYVQQLQPFYELPASALAPDVAERNKVTGLYLLLLLTQGRYGEFHTELEGLACREGGGDDVEGDRYLGYPVRLERWLMEGSYDRVWNAMRKGEVPCEEYGVFSEILTSQIRSEIASSSERAYPSLPLSSTKSLLFLNSEGAVVDFAKQRGWTIRDGTIYFPDLEQQQQQQAATSEDEDDSETGPSGASSATVVAVPNNKDEQMSRVVIDNALGYARELETIV